MSGPGSPTSDGEILGFTLAGLAVGAGLVAWGSAQITAATSGGVTPPGSPVKFALSLGDGTYIWTGADTVVAAVLAAVLMTAVTLVVLRVTGRHGRDHVDQRARRLVRSPEISRYIGAAPGRLGGFSGPPIGRILPGGVKVLTATPEDQIIEISGPRTGKTMSRAIPAILSWPGPVVVTSNKRDIVDATRGPREGKGPVWLFDPQRLAGGTADWWWNPLSTVTDVRTARKLAAIWATTSRPHESRADSYFDPAGEELLAMLLLAAAGGGRPVSDVYHWLTDANDDTPRGLLHEQGQTMWERGLEMQQTLPDKQRAGVYGTAQKFVAFLADAEVLAWVTDPGGQRRRFDAAEFVEGTLYSLSKEGEGSMAPLVTALTAAVLESAEYRASLCPGGRLPIPLLGVLDEAGNVCPWRTLPDLVSHYGSRGIVLMTILQSWSQGITAWGEHGMRKLWGACNVRIYGGGVSDHDFLRMLSAMCGEYEAETRSTSNSGKGGRTTSVSTRKEPVFDVAALGSMPKWRALVLLSGARPVLVRSEPWWEGPHAEAVAASIARFDATAEIPDAAPVTNGTQRPRRLSVRRRRGATAHRRPLTPKSGPGQPLLGRE
jgi:type IV secretory pathway TraG/TraD family ATPase VirD4